MSPECFWSEGVLALPGTVAGALIAAFALGLWALVVRRRGRPAPWGRALLLWSVGVVLAHAAMLVVLHQPALRGPIEVSGSADAYVAPIALVVLAEVVFVAALVGIGRLRGRRR